LEPDAYGMKETTSFLMKRFQVALPGSLLSKMKSLAILSGSSKDFTNIFLFFLVSFSAS